MGAPVASTSSLSTAKKPKKATLKAKANKKRKRLENAGEVVDQDVSMVNPYALASKKSKPSERSEEQSYRMQSPTFSPPSPTLSNSEAGSATKKQYNPFARDSRPHGTLGPPLPDRLAKPSTTPKKMPNYASLASPSPPTVTRGVGSSSVARPTRSAAAAAGSPDPSYAPTTTGVYPPMGTSSFMSGGSMTMSRQVASMRATNAQWWAGYWFALSEVLPDGNYDQVGQIPDGQQAYEAQDGSDEGDDDGN